MSYKNFYRVISKETADAFLEMVKNSGKSKNQFALQQGFNRIAYNKLKQGKKMHSGRKDYKIVKKLCKENGIPFEYEIRRAI